MLTSLKRIIRSGRKSFARNIGLNTAMIFILTAVVLLVSFLYMFNLAAKILINDLQEKVNISVYFKEDALSDDIMKIKSEVSKLPEVKSVEYISKEQCLENFISIHKNDQIILESLDEIGGNPFLASLSIKAVQAVQYEQIAKFFENNQYDNIIEKVDYYERKPVMEKIFAITSGINKAGIALVIVFGLVAILVAFNTIKIAIYNFNQEISTMRLVGASNWFVRGPFLVQGAINGLIAFLISIVLTFIFCFALDAKISLLTQNVSVLALFTNNFWWLLLIQFASGVGLGIVSTYIAIRKYLKI